MGIFFVCVVISVVFVLVTDKEQMVVGPLGNLRLRASEATEGIIGSMFDDRDSPAKQTARLRISNKCNHDVLWLQSSRNFTRVGPMKVSPNSFVDFDLANESIGRVTYWPSTACQGYDECKFEGSPDHDPKAEQGAPRVPSPRSKLQASFGAVGHTCDPDNGDLKGCDFLDVGLQDGYTLPFRLIVKGDCRRKTHHEEEDDVTRIVDCSNLSLKSCPALEELDPSIDAIDLRVADERSGQTVGCQSPCGRLSQAGPGTISGIDPQDFCCTGDDCQDGLSAKTSYAKRVQEMCPDAAVGGMGTGTCPAGTKYEMVFLCPTFAQNQIPRL